MPDGSIQAKKGKHAKSGDGRERSSFSQEDDKLLVKYLAIYNPGTIGRRGNSVYQKLVENKDNKWSWANHHPWSGWRERYVRHSDWMDLKISEYQRKKGIKAPTPAPTPTPNATPGPSQQPMKKRSAKRMQTVDEQEEEAMADFRKEAMKEEVEEDTQEATMGATPARALSPEAGPSQPRRSARFEDEATPVAPTRAKTTKKRKRVEEEEPEPEPVRKRADKSKDKGKAHSTNLRSSVSLRAAAPPPPKEAEDEAAARATARERVLAVKQKASKSEVAGTRRRLEHETEVEGTVDRRASLRRRESTATHGHQGLDSQEATLVQEQSQPGRTPTDQEVVPATESEGDLPQEEEEDVPPPTVHDLEPNPLEVVPEVVEEEDLQALGDVDDGVPPPSDDYRGEVFEDDEEVAESEHVEDQDSEMEAGDEGVLDAQKTPTVNTSITKEQAASVLQALYPDASPAVTHANIQNDASPGRINTSVSPDTSPFPRSAAPPPSSIPRSAEMLSFMIPETPTGGPRQVQYGHILQYRNGNPTTALRPALSLPESSFGDLNATPRVSVKREEKEARIAQEPTPPTSNVNTEHEVDPRTPRNTTQHKAVRKTVDQPRQPREEASDEEQIHPFAAGSGDVAPPYVPTSSSVLPVEEEEESDDDFTTLASTSHRQTPQVRREPPRLVDGHYVSAFTNGRGQKRFSLGGCRGGAVTDSDEEPEEAPARNAQTPRRDSDWPPRRGERVSRTAVAEISRSAAAERQVEHHPFSQPTQVSTREVDQLSSQPKPSRRLSGFVNAEVGPSRLPAQPVSRASVARMPLFLPDSSEEEEENHPFGRASLLLPGDDIPNNEPEEAEEEEFVRQADVQEGDHHPFSQPTQRSEVENFLEDDIEEVDEVDEVEEVEEDEAENGSESERHPFSQPTQQPLKTGLGISISDDEVAFPVNGESFVQNPDVQGTLAMSDVDRDEHSQVALDNATVPEEGINVNAEDGAADLSPKLESPQSFPNGTVTPSLDPRLRVPPPKLALSNLVVNQLPSADVDTPSKEMTVMSWRAKMSPNIAHLDGHTGPFRPPPEPFKPPSPTVEVPEDQPFTKPSLDKGKGKAIESPRRQTFGGFHPEISDDGAFAANVSGRVSRKAIRRVRMSLPNLNRPPRPSRTLSSAIADPKPLSINTDPEILRLINENVLSDADTALALSIGLELLRDKMSANHGFNKEVVMRMMEHAGDIRRTDENLRKMREAAQAAGLALLATQNRHEEDEDEEDEADEEDEPEDDVDVDAYQDVAPDVDEEVDDEVEHAPSAPDLYRATSSVSRTRRAPRPSLAPSMVSTYGLVYTPAEVEPEDLIRQTPPPLSRAGQLVRSARKISDLFSAELLQNDTFLDLVKAGGASPIRVVRDEDDESLYTDRRAVSRQSEEVSPEPEEEEGSSAEHASDDDGMDVDDLGEGSSALTLSQQSAKPREDGPASPSHVLPVGIPQTPEGKREALPDQTRSVRKSLAAWFGLA